jgi:DNA-binding NarL/FixJ family response regulator
MNGDPPGVLLKGMRRGEALRRILWVQWIRGIIMTKETARIRLLTVDDHPLLREGIAAVIANQPDMVLVAEAANGQQAIESFRKHVPDVTLMDLKLPDMSGIDAIQKIHDSFPCARIVVLTTYKGDVQAIRALRAGAAGYLLKSSLRKDLLDTIRQVHAGRRCIPREVAAEMAEYLTDDSLTSREIQVLREVAKGNANKMIASKLSITEDTVKAHVKSILAKLAANDRTHAVTIALRRGFLDL